MSPAGTVPARRILVVDDNRDAARSLGMVLELLGHEVHLAFDGRTALKEAEAHCPEVIVLDIGLPGLDGYAVARQLRSQELTRNITLLALTGYAMEEDRRQALAAGFDHHLVKPVDTALLQKLLAERRA